MCCAVSCVGVGTGKEREKLLEIAKEMLKYTAARRGDPDPLPGKRPMYQPCEFHGMGAVTMKTDGLGGNGHWPQEGHDVPLFCHPQHLRYGLRRIVDQRIGLRPRGEAAIGLVCPVGKDLADEPDTGGIGGTSHFASAETVQ